MFLFNNRAQEKMKGGGVEGVPHRWAAGCWSKSILGCSGLEASGRLFPTLGPEEGPDAEGPWCCPCPPSANRQRGR